jgi:tRNA-modifying protein YgfZ
VPVTFDEFAPDVGVAVMAGDREVGTMGSAAAGRGLAKLRLDRVGEALAAGTPLLAGGLAIRLVKPNWARFPFPGETPTAA